MKIDIVPSLAAALRFLVPSERAATLALSENMLAVILVGEKYTFI